jgi:hypothetical protein
MLSQLRIAGHIQKLLSTDLSTDIQARLPLDDFVRGLAEYKQHMTSGKILLLP